MPDNAAITDRALLGINSEIPQIPACGLLLYVSCVRQATQVHCDSSDSTYAPELSWPMTMTSCFDLVVAAAAGDFV